MKALRTIHLDKNNKADEIKPKLWALRQRSQYGQVKTIYLTADMLIWLASEIKNPTSGANEPIMIGGKP